ncbi:hypothetical protein TNCV_1920721 [Trichonephila clavipes]|nr:hypothetical protein TNCV_1920721 [Trichonephila clavipes]
MRLEEHKERVPAQVSSTSLEYASKLRGPSPKALAIQCDVNIQSFIPTLLGWTVHLLHLELHSGFRLVGGVVFFGRPLVVEENNQWPSHDALHTTVPEHKTLTALSLLLIMLEIQNLGGRTGKILRPSSVALKSKNQEINRLQLAVKLPWAIFFESVDILS